jgi:hypothetical protein
VGLFRYPAFHRQGQTPNTPAGSSLSPCNGMKAMETRMILSEFLRYLGIKLPICR